MCVAVVIESEAGPTLTELRLMESDNPHGAGMAWADGNVVRYRKGMTAGQCFALLKKIPRPALLHFRWATHGPKVARLTHPFPLGYRAITSTKLKGKAPAVLIHNGVWRDYEKYAPGWIKAFPEASDTAVAALLAEWNEDILDKVQWCTAVGRAAGNGRMDVTLRGDWESHNGDTYSNLNWQPRKWAGLSGYAGGYQTGWAFDSDWESYMEAKYGTNLNEYRARGGVQPSHSAYDDDPIGMVMDIPTEAADQLLSEEPTKIEIRTDMGPPAVRRSDFFEEHAEVQAALAKMEGCQPSHGMCTKHPSCVMRAGHAEWGCYDAQGVLVAWRKLDGTIIDIAAGRKPLMRDGKPVAWNREGKMVHLTATPKIGEGCE